jgi:hypothetical protein
VKDNWFSSALDQVVPDSQTIDWQNGIFKFDGKKNLESTCNITEPIQVLDVLAPFPGKIIIGNNGLTVTKSGQFTAPTATITGGKLTLQTGCSFSWTSGIMSATGPNQGTVATAIVVQAGAKLTLQGTDQVQTSPLLVNRALIIQSPNPALNPNAPPALAAMQVQLNKGILGLGRFWY